MIFRVGMKASYDSFMYVASGLTQHLPRHETSVLFVEIPERDIAMAEDALKNRLMELLALELEGGS